MTRWYERPELVGLAAGLLAWATALSGVLIVNRIVARTALDDLRAYLGHTVSTTAALIDGDALAQFTRPEQDTSPEYERAVRPLRTLLATNPEIRFAYTGVTEGDRMHFVLDGSPLDNAPHVGLSEHAHPMDDDKASPGEIEVTRTHRVTVESEPTMSAWGAGIRAQAPIFGSRGVMVGYAGVTMRADRYYDAVHRADWAAAIGGLVAGLISAGIGVLVYHLERRRRDAEAAQLNLEGQLIRERDQVRQYAQALDRADEDARRQTASELHERVSQTLAGQNLLLSTARLQTADAPVQAMIDKVLSTSRDALTEIRTMIQNLSPPELSGASLSQILEWLTELFGSRHDFAVTWSLSGTADLPPEQRMLIYRIVRELLFNAFRHSQVDRASVGVVLNPEVVEIVVADRGVGFEPDALAKGTGGAFGLTRVAERVRAAGGTFRVNSSPGEGCRVQVSIPVMPPDPGL
jgi:signal transduction histidine kinase